MKLFTLFLIILHSQWAAAAPRGICRPQSFARLYNLRPSIEPLRKNSYVLDTAILGAIHADPAKLPPGAEQTRSRILKKLKENNIPIPVSGKSLFITDTIMNEMAPHLQYHANTFLPGIRRIKLLKPKNSPEYKSIYQQLERMNVGERKGIKDRTIITDLFFAAKEDHAIPRFVTTDYEIYKKLYQLTGKPTRLPGSNVDEPIPREFNLSLKDSTGKIRTLQIYPIPTH